MAEVVKMPKMSDTMTEGVLAKWHKKVGDKVKSGDVLAEIETDKATMDFESYQDGTLLYIGVEEGSAVPVDAVIAVLGKEGEDYKAVLAQDGGAQKKEEKPAEATAPAKAEDKQPAPVAAAAPKVDLSSIPATVIRMPALSDTMTEGIIEKWNFKVGDKVKSDDSLADVATDKATMEVVGYEAGTLLYIGPKEGEAAPVNGIIAIVGKEGTDITPLLQDAASAPAAPAEEAAPAAKAETTATADDAPASSTTDDSRVKASPLARKIAKDKGINLNDVKGSAEGGRIIRKDVEGFVAPAKTAAAPASTEAAPGAPASAAPTKAPVTIPTFIGEEKFTEKPVSQMRKVIAKRLSESLFTAPHFYVTMSIDMDQAVEARAKINEVAPVKISFNDFVVKACALALKQHPNINSSWLGDKIRYNEHVNIGVAVAVDEGLLVPVIRFADGKSLSHISVEVKDFAQRAKAKKLQPSDWEGSTFTISNLGMFGVDEFTAIINSPDSCILAVSGIQQVPVVKNGAVVPGNVMKVTLSCDHRVVDGATGAAFLQTLKSLLEEPVRLLI
ncbi:pyruvate dehydrogenase complex dihydrolipoamide acetyltransferase [Mucilaginibacter lappiensis]|uniref:Dihydrolipoamide acetyltransferase component of pyruvate dehydrogenase complex n=1 Tax=Mucilaginibacter lappiensis TaxID=354630 RepID=A0A1N7EFT0_9SPHI|nr:pyruvate dehydrogenase complex dihydrolipoamide acetyltransferase [Mucilaginibacter lappiensis]MBB6111745.1 pyruvate dehydrogenase E2 component (dihydrolipoamide acetyltransferase) [Mucilaginibacter lappiensis]MBB6128392.1 pyruvate dehydrogenase E2 component (dihydrolipoamide acetyltransferase) [Mucilaginibacter lappiensis]SIR86951.1 pyruvate dehydrogenase E2 component (dihydrolipoamide acetyltransferase) [Mucilaginibacter lappiensis]